MLAGLARGAAAQADSAARPGTASDSTNPRIHLRVLGVFDEETGDPIEGADVTDMLTRITTRSTKTGTVALILSDTMGTLVRVKKVGYQQATLVVGTALSDTAPVTATMLRAGHVLAKMITIGTRSVMLGKADTVSELLRNGFYERRETGGAPRNAFIDGQKLQGTSLVSNARFFGRGICESNLYIDGARIAAPQRTGHFMKEGVDALVDPYDVAGIETYVTGDAPIDAMHTTAGPSSMDIAATTLANQFSTAAGTMASTGCVTMIWLKH